MIKRFFQSRAKSFFKPNLEGYTVTPDDAITLNARDSEGDKTMEKISFDTISDGHKVYALFGIIQREQT